MSEGYDQRLKFLLARTMKANEDLVDENEALRRENGQLKTKLIAAAQRIKQISFPGQYYAPHLEREKEELDRRLEQEPTFTPRQGRDVSVIEGPLTSVELETSPGTSLLTDSPVTVNSDGPEDWTDE